ncbi:sensor histidine kinase [Rubrivirga marina]|uniref:Oxygen sensor histidine kinase NreB n=1 Tax=Rubrivirga marina TaxID=1196024 RepID=A0A271J1W3_9BACT|nr:sensor histidine kinase [Rubrivirga marina]PAP76689.1 hypothetical protein BSZ37_09680 [Rubrivirga marina]
MRAVWLFLLLGAPTSAPAQPWSFERVGDLPHSTVMALRQDDRGFLWAGTPDGLTRYDGRRVAVFRARPGQAGSLPSSTVQALALDAEGALWVGTPAGACRLADEAHGRFVCPGPRLDVLDLFEAEGTLWAVDREALWRLDGGSFRRVRGSPAEESGAVRVHGARDGAVWTLRATAGSPTVRWLRYDVARGRLVERAAERVPDQAVGIVTATGRLLTVPADRIQALGWGAERPAVLGTVSTAVAEDGAVWVGSGRGLLRWTTGAVEAVPLPGGSPLSQAVLAIVVDRAGAVWVGTRSGLFVHDPARARFSHLDPSDVGAAAPVMAATTSTDGALWIGTFGGGLVRQRPGRPPEAAPGAPEDALVWALRPAPDGGLWVGTDNGVCRRDVGGRSTCLRAPLARSDGDAFVYALEGDGAGGVWAAGSSLVRLDGRSGAIVRRVETEPVGTPTALHRDRGGRLWVAVEKRGLWRLDERAGRLRPVAVPALAAASVWAIHEAADGALWLGTSDGLLRLDPEAARGEAHAPGLGGSTVYGVVPDGDRLWLTTARGLVRYRPADGALRRFGADEGVRNVEFNRRAVHRAPDGRVHLGGMAGLTTFDPAAFGDDGALPTAVVTRLRVDGPGGTEVYGGAAVRLGPSARALTFEVAAPLPSGGSALRYAYRLGPLDADWVEIEGEPVVRLAGLPPGAYRFEARASRGDGVWGAPAAVAVTLDPPWYRTGWFRFVAAALLAALVVGAVQLRVRAVRREERMRWRIASDLHDDVGSRLASVALLAEHVRDQGALDPPEASQLTAVAQAARGMVESLREIVWFVDPSHERPGSFAARTREAAASLVGPRATVEAPDRSRLDAAPLAVRRDVFLILKEALHNAARHAGGATVAVRIEESGRELVLSVRDEGPGFDPAAARSGTGLRSLRRRAEALGGTLDVASAPGEGTAVTLRAPLP